MSNRSIETEALSQYEIIEMAEQAGFLTNEIKSYVISPYTFEDQDLYQELEAFAKLVAAKEREACAKECDEYTAVGKIEEFDRGWLACARTIASVIRARAQANKGEA